MVIVIMGVSGSGKSTVGRALAETVGADFHDADDFHPERNVEKMRRGIPLEASDREPWLDALRGALDAWRKQHGTVVLACSALTERIRRHLDLDAPEVRVVHLRGDEALLTARLAGRQHFMPPELLPTQLALLEPPADALELDAHRPVEDLVAQIRAAYSL